jgi:hypothetical protein
MNNSTRDEKGLLKGVTYHFNEDGTVNYRKMVSSKHLVLNRQYKTELEEKTGKAFDDIKPDEVEDRHLLILLSGIKEVAKLRGYVSVNQRINASTPAHASATCSITWKANFESEFEAQTFSDSANANLENTDGFSRSYLDAIAANRAFVRAVRNYLNIHIVGKDEVGPIKASKTTASVAQVVKETIAPDGPAPQEELNPQTEETTQAPKVEEKKPQNHTLLEDLATQKGYTFESFRARIIEKHLKKIKSDPANWTGFNDSIPSRDVYVLTDLLMSAKKQ